VFHWTAKQTYIALSTAMNACVVLTIRYRHNDDISQNSKKYRKPIDTLFEQI